MGILSYLLPSKYGSQQYHQVSLLWMNTHERENKIIIINYWKIDINRMIESLYKYTRVRWGVITNFVPYYDVRSYCIIESTRINKIKIAELPEVQRCCRGEVILPFQCGICSSGMDRLRLASSHWLYWLRKAGKWKNRLNQNGKEHNITRDRMKKMSKTPLLRPTLELASLHVSSSCRQSLPKLLRRVR